MVLKILLLAFVFVINGCSWLSREKGSRTAIVNEPKPDHTISVSAQWQVQPNSLTLPANKQLIIRIAPAEADNFTVRFNGVLIRAKDAPDIELAALENGPQGSYLPPKDFTAVLAQGIQTDGPGSAVILKTPSLEPGYYQIRSLFPGHGESMTVQVVVQE